MKCGHQYEPMVSTRSQFNPPIRINVPNAPTGIIVFLVSSIGFFVIAQVMSLIYEDERGFFLVLIRSLLSLLCLMALAKVAVKITSVIHGNHKVIIFALAIFFLHVGFAVLFYYWYWLPEHIQKYDIYTGFDSLRYEYYGNQLAESWRENGFNLSVIVAMNPANIGHYIFCAIVYYIFGFDRILTVILSSAFIVLAGLGAWRLSINVGASIKGAMLAFIIVASNFQSFLYGSLSGKDGMVYSILIWIFVFFINFISVKNKTTSNLLPLMALILALFLLRYGAGFAVILFMLIAVILSLSLGWNIGFKKRISILLAIGAILGAALAVLTTVGSVEYILNRDYFSAHGVGRSVEELRDVGWGIDQSGLAYRLVGNLDIYHIYLLPLSWVLQFLDPFPYWVFDSYTKYFMSPHVVLNLLLMPFAISGIAGCLRGKWGLNGRLLVIYFLCILTAVSFSMIGVNNRYLMSALPFYYVLVVLGVDAAKGPSILRQIFLGILLIVGLSVAYLILKS